MCKQVPFPSPQPSHLFIAYANLLDQVKFMMKKDILFSSGGDKHILVSPLLLLHQLT